MSDYIISQISPSDTRANKQINELLLAEGIRRDANLDYTCGMYDDEMNIIATGSCFGNTLRCMAVSSEATSSPPMIVAAMPPNIESNSSGSIPRIVVPEAIMTGTILDRVADRTAS